MQFGELADHLRLQVGLGDPRGLGRQIGGGADQGRDLARERLDAGDAVGLRPELVVEGDMREPCRHAFHADLGNGAQVVLPEEFGVGQPGREHLRVAGKDGRAVVRGLAVGDGDEGFDPPGRRVADGKELLVFAHRGLQDLRRQVEEGLVDPPDQHHRPFDQPRDLGQEALVLDQLQPGREGGVAGRRSRYALPALAGSSITKARFSFAA